MVKMLMCLACAFLTAVAALQLRQQHLELRYQAATLQQQIENQQAKLWNQQVQIAIPTVPNAIKETVGKDLPIVPEAKLPGKSGDWIKAEIDPGE